MRGNRIALLSWAKYIVIAVLILLGNTRAFAAEEEHALPPARLEGRELVEALRGGGKIIFMRHSISDTTQVDESLTDINNCATQRNLSEAGRAQARSIGDAFSELGIPVGSVISSPFCRCRETGQLAFGHVQLSENLYYTVRDDKVTRSNRSLELRKLLAKAPETGKNTVLISHTANLKEAVNIWPESEGIIMVFEPSGAGEPTYLGKVAANEWQSLISQFAANQVGKGALTGRSSTPDIGGKH